jgi:hypothetical protein
MEGTAKSGKERMSAKCRGALARGRDFGHGGLILFLRVDHGDALFRCCGHEALVGNPELDWLTELLLQPQCRRGMNRIESAQRMSTHQATDMGRGRTIYQNLIVGGPLGFKCVSNPAELRGRDSFVPMLARQGGMHLGR